MHFKSQSFLLCAKYLFISIIFATKAQRHQVYKTLLLRDFVAKKAMLSYITYLTFDKKQKYKTKNHFFIIYEMF